MRKKEEKLSGHFWDINHLSEKFTTYDVRRTTDESALEKLRCLPAGGYMSWRKKHVMTSRCISWPQKVWKSTPKTCVMTSKNTESTLWHEKVCQKVHNNVKKYIIKSISMYVKYVMISKITSWRQKVCHNVKKYVKYVMMSKSTSVWAMSKIYIICHLLKNIESTI